MVTPLCIVLLGLSPASTPAPELAWDLQSPNEVSGGTAHFSPVSVTQGVLVGVTVWDPYVYLRIPGGSLDAKRYTRMIARIYSSEKADVLSVYYNSPNGQWGLGKTVPIEKGWAVYSVDLTKAGWGESGGGASACQWGGSTGKVTSLRIDPGNQADRWVVVDSVRLVSSDEASFKSGVQREAPIIGRLAAVRAPAEIVAGGTIDVELKLTLDPPPSTPLPGFICLAPGKRIARIHGFAIEAGKTSITVKTPLPTSLAAPPGTLGVRLVVPGVEIEHAGPDVNVATVNLRNPRAGKMRPPHTTVERLGGDPALLVGGKPVASFFLATFDRGFGQRGRWHRQFAEFDLHLYSDWFGSSTAGRLGQIKPGEYDYGEFDTYFADVLEVDPNAYFLPHIGITAPRWWQDAHPEELCLYHDGTRGPQSFASLPWRENVTEDLTRLIKHFEQTPYADRILGYIIYSGYSAEWQSWGLWQDKLADYSAPATRAWRDWLKTRYGNDETIKRAWADESASLAQAKPPSPEERHHAELGVLRDPRRERKSIDYYQFLADLTAEAIATFSKVTKEACGGKSIVGTYYGYLTQHGGRQQDSSHLALEKVLRSPHVDFLMSPPLYTDRQIRGTSGFMAPTESVRLHGKLWLSEADYRTHLSDLGAGYGRATSLADSRAILLREMGDILTRRAAVSWYDMVGGWLASPDLLTDLRRMRDVQQASLASREPFHPDIAVIVDEESFTYLKPMHRVNAQLVMHQITAMPRVGASWGFYLLSDLPLEGFPPHKLYLFLNTVKVGREMRETIRSRLQREGATAVWVYASGFHGDEGCGTEQMSHLTGIQVKEIDWGKPLWLGESGGALAGSDVVIERVFVIDDASSEPMDKIRGTDLVGLARKKRDGWMSVFCSVPTLSPTLLRRLARQARCHVYLDSGDAIAVDDAFVCIHASFDGAKTIVLPHVADMVDAMTGQVLDHGTARLTLPMKQGQTRLIACRRRK